jgi:hypothetical protein
MSSLSVFILLLAKKEIRRSGASVFLGKSRKMGKRR